MAIQELERGLTMQMQSSWYERIAAPRTSTCLACSRTIPYYGDLEELKAEQWRRSLCPSCVEHIPFIEEVGCSSCGRHIRCEDCQRQPLQQYGLAYNRSVVQYQEHMKEWLALCKFKGNQSIAFVMAGMMIEQYMPLALTAKVNKPTRSSSDWWSMLKEWWNPESIIEYPDLVTYVPSSLERLEERGFNQAELLAGTLAKAWGRPLLNCLDRTRDTGKQSQQSRAGREQSLEGTFTWNQAAFQGIRFYMARQPKPYLHILLVDDVYTTGSTIRACARALQDGLRELHIQGMVSSYTWARA